jgi:hypothetical protein
MSSGDVEREVAAACDARRVSFGCHVWSWTSARRSTYDKLGVERLIDGALSALNISDHNIRAGPHLKGTADEIEVLFAT